jgi:hypothetical protein
LRWHCRSAPPGASSTGSLYVQQTRYPQIPIAGLWACVNHQTFGQRSDLQRAGALESVAQRRSKINL